jgi:uncharacterized membrane protein (UPF0182 family)
MPPRAPRPRRNRPRRRWFAGRGRVIVIGILVLLVVLFVSARTVAGYYVDFLWYRSLGQSSTYWTLFWAKLSLLLIFAVGFAVVAAVNFIVADRIAPLYVPDPAGLAFVDRYRELVGARQRWVRIGAAAVLGLMLGVPTMGEWREWLLFRNYQSFGVADPQFDTDVGFYVFRLPFLSYLMTWGFAAIAVLGLAVAATYVANGSMRFQMHGLHLTRGARVHLSILGALLALVKAGDYWLQRYSLTTSTRGAVHGATYTDVKAQLPAINLLILVCLLVAALFLISLRRGGWRLPVAAAGLWLVVAVVAGAVYPAVVQRFVVQPNVANRERPYIERNLEATRAAMGIDEVEVRDIEVGSVTDTDVAADAAALQDARLLNPSQMEQRFNLDQRRTTFYGINDLDPDRYEIDGRTQQVLVAARELNPDGLPSKAWVSRHLTYTHGCGVVAAPASKVETDGSPVYQELETTRPELYVGEGLGDYAITNTDNDEQPCGGETAPYEGTNGVKLDSALTRLAFAVHFGEYNLFGSSLITGDSQILYVRDVRERVEKVAPFLSVDSDPYPVVIDGTVQWVVDAFTTTSRYPYAQRANTSQLADDSALKHKFNYVRNSVKAVVDAYTGVVTLYIVDDTDPLARAWQSAFPDLFTPGSEIPAELREHFRYPEDLFRAQTGLYGRYQIENPAQFFTGDLRWSVAQNPSDQPETSGAAGTATGGATTTTEALREADTGNVADPDSPRFVPYYSMFHDPDGAVTFSLLQPFVPFSSNDSLRSLAGYMTVSSDPDSYGRLTLYRVLGEQPGPSIVAAEMDSDPTIASAITLLGQQGSEVRYGNLQLIPVGSGLLYVRPVYLQPAGRQDGQLYLRRVIVARGGRAVMAETLTEALAQLFPDASVDLGEVVGGTTITPPEGEEPPADRTPAQLLAAAEELFAQADEALATGTPEGFAEYAQLTEEARRLVTDALAQLDSTATTTTLPSDAGTGDEAPADGGADEEGTEGDSATPPSATSTTAPPGRARSGGSGALAGQLIGQRGQVLAEGDLVPGLLAGEPFLPSAQAVGVVLDPLDRARQAVDVALQPTDITTQSAHGGDGLARVGPGLQGIDLPRQLGELVGQLVADRGDPLLQASDHLGELAAIGLPRVQPAGERVELHTQPGDRGGHGRELRGIDGWLAPEETHDGGHRTGREHAERVDVRRGTVAARRRRRA